MKTDIIQIAILVDDYDEAILFYTQKLNFDLIEDTIMSETKRWVLVAPPGSNGCRVLLAKAANDEQKQCVGNQTGGRVFLFLQTDNFQQYFEYLHSNGVTIVRGPSVESYGKVAVFADLYGNLWDLIEPVKKVFCR